jgi:hypothetical protein
MAEKSKNNPIIVFQCGPVKASVWTDPKVIDNAIVDVHSIRIDRAYKDKKDNEWKYTTTFYREDLPKVALVANEAYKYVRMRTYEPETSQNDNNDDSQHEQTDDFPAS